MGNNAPRFSKPHKIALATMPFAPAEGPSIQLGILKSCLTKAGFEADDFYFNIDFFRLMKKHDCHNIYNSTLPALVSEWFFSPVPFKRKTGLLQMEAMNRLQAFSRTMNISLDAIFRIKEEFAPGFIDRMAGEIDWSQYFAVCFTLSYAQINASFALARKIKEKNPGIKTVFGGAFSQIHEESCLEFMRVFNFIDYFVLGDAEPVVGALMKGIAEGSEISKLPGIFYRSNDKIQYTGGLSVQEDMNRAPFPDYSGYFKLYRSLDYSERIHFRRYMPMEMARGCTWGQHRPCTFCAFYPCGGYRPKSPETIEEEIRRQIKANGARAIYIVDAAVSRKIIEEAFPRIRDIGKNINIPFIEVRTNMKEDHVRLLKEAGVTLVQPGIEALDDGILKKMNKGVTLFSNLLFMKWCSKYGIRISYNIIMGVPNATPEDISNQSEVIQLIHHLDPPFFMPLSLVRFSDYYRNPDKYPIKNMRPDSFYRHIYPPDLDIEKVAFDYVADYTIDISAIVLPYQDTLRQIQKWRMKWNSFNPPFLTIKKKEDHIIISDGRETPLKPVKHTYNGVKAEIYMTCMNRPGNPKSIKRALSGTYHTAMHSGSIIPGSRAATAPGSVGSGSQAATAPGSVESGSRAATAPGSVESGSRAATAPGSVESGSRAATAPGSVESGSRAATAPGVIKGFDNENLTEKSSGNTTIEEIESALKEFEDKGLVIKRMGLSLALCTEVSE